MANLNTTTSGYPAAIDTAPTLTDGSSGDEIVAAHQNGRGSAVVNIEMELGTDVAGTQTDLKTRLAVALNDDGTVKSSVIVANTPTSVSYSGGVFTLTTTPNSNLSGNLVQMISTQVTGFTTTNGIIPRDNTPPQSSEGSSFGLTVDMKPTSTLNSIYVHAQLNGTGNVDNGSGHAALFLAGSSSAVTGCRAPTQAAANNMGSWGFLWKATTVSTATTSYTLNVGVSTAGTYTLNGEGGAGLFANTVVSNLMVYEVQN